LPARPFLSELWSTRRVRRRPALGLHHARDQAADRFEAAEGLLFPGTDALDHAGDASFVVPIDADHEGAASGSVQ
jgi:hypothetical protein